MERAHQYWNSAIFHRRGLQNESPVYCKRFILSTFQTASAGIARWHNRHSVHSCMWIAKTVEKSAVSVLHFPLYCPKLEWLLWTKLEMWTKYRCDTPFVPQLWLRNGKTPTNSVNNGVADTFWHDHYIRILHSTQNFSCLFPPMAKHTPNNASIFIRHT